MTFSKPEIMAPAGDWISLQAAVQAGADAVYFGIKGLNMRAGSKNFDLADLPRIAEKCHAHNLRAYLTLNTIIYESELDLLPNRLDAAAAAHIDGVICWDFAVIRELTRRQLPIFLSTQMSVANSASLLFFYRTLGVRRFVLARECSLKDIVTIRQNLALELGAAAGEIQLEVFAHGAMCVSISGRCFMSQFQSGKSANRGECQQQCRRDYLVTNPATGQQFRLDTPYVMSPNDLCTLPFLDQLLDAGINSLKIEGRGRSPEYVRTVTDAYRQAVDFYAEKRHQDDFAQEFKELTGRLQKQLQTVYNRGFSSGFYLGQPLDDWYNRDGSQATTRKMYVGPVLNFYKQQEVAEILVESHEFDAGEEIMIQGPTTGVVTRVVDSLEVDHRAVTRAKQGQRLGIKFDHPVRPNDKVYVIREAQDEDPITQI